MNVLRSLALFSLALGLFVAAGCAHTRQSRPCGCLEAEHGPCHLVCWEEDEESPHWRHSARMGMGAGMGCGMGPGMHPGMGCGMGPGMGCGMGPGMGCGMGPGMGCGMGPGMGCGMRSGMGMRPGMGMGGCGMMGMGPAMRGAIAKLPPDERHRLRRIHLDLMKEVAPKAAEIRVQTIELIDTMHAYPVDRSATEKQYQEIASQRNAIQHALLTHLAEAQKVVGKDQWDAVMEAMPAHCGMAAAPGMWGARGGWGRGAGSPMRGMGMGMGMCTGMGGLWMGEHIGPLLQQLPPDKRMELEKADTEATQKLLVKRGELQAEMLGLRETIASYPLDESAAKDQLGKIDATRADIFHIMLDEMQRAQEIVGEKTWDQLSEEGTSGAYSS